MKNSLAKKIAVVLTAVSAALVVSFGVSYALVCSFVREVE